MQMDKLSKKLREAREEKGLSQKQLANLLFIDRSAISKWESGTNVPPLDKIADVCQMLGLEPNNLLSGEASILTHDKEEARMTLEEIIDACTGPIQTTHYQGTIEVINGLRDYMELETAKKGHTGTFAMEWNPKSGAWDTQNHFQIYVDKESGELSAVRERNGRCSTDLVACFKGDQIPVPYDMAAGSFDADLTKDMAADCGGIKNAQAQNIYMFDDTCKELITLCENERKLVKEFTKKQNGKKIVILIRWYLFNDYLGWLPSQDKLVIVKDYKRCTPSFRVKSDNGVEESEGSYAVYVPSKSFRDRYDTYITDDVLDERCAWDPFISVEPLNLSIKKDAYTSIEAYMRNKAYNPTLEIVPAEEQEFLLTEATTLINHCRTNDIHLGVMRNLRSLERQLESAQRLITLNAPINILADSFRLIKKRIAEVKEELALSDQIVEAEAAVFARHAKEDEAQEPADNDAIEKNLNRFAKAYDTILSMDDEKRKILNRYYDDLMNYALRAMEVPEADIFTERLFTYYAALPQGDIREALMIVLPSTYISYAKNKTDSPKLKRFGEGRLSEQYVRFLCVMDELEARGIQPLSKEHNLLNYNLNLPVF